ncbi:MAG: nucleotide kinase [Bilophila wadsworthia]
MKKQLILVGGAMGVGKSAVCRELLRQLTPGVWLDGDWCWNMNPFVVSEENKRMVLSNITHLLRAYLNNSSYRYVLFCWVMDQPLLFEAVLGPLRDIPFTLHSFSPVCRSRLCGNGWNATHGTSGRPTSSAKPPAAAAYAELPTFKLAVTSLTPYDAACAIAASVGRASSRRVPGLSGAGESWHGA